MPFTPAPTGTPPADTDTPIDITLTVANTAEDLVLVPSLKTGRTISLVNEGPGRAFIAFDGTATIADTEIKKGESYGEVNLDISTNVSFIGESGKTPRVRGVLWSGD